MCVYIKRVGFPRFLARAWQLGVGQITKNRAVFGAPKGAPNQGKTQGKHYLLEENPWIFQGIFHDGGKTGGRPRARPLSGPQPAQPCSADVDSVRNMCRIDVGGALGRLGT